ncbi:hypothetical protein [Conexibacter sp. CPCC 206217]|uniref:hypothetical protein n=1 Tax=Conexibacter sp. CPCC 206217 TaxID=3064574 RepID=UPI002728EDC2|nr:hypothetical protein [Conexibacter sp. CPCC 206217]MDO8208987.1 hypothetical protein [Conexibacter sp. CPCC 206217]
MRSTSPLVALMLVALSIVGAGAAAGIALLTRSELPPPTGTTAALARTAIVRGPTTTATAPAETRPRPNEAEGSSSELRQPTRRHARSTGLFSWLRERDLVVLLALAAVAGTVFGVVSAAVMTARVVTRRIRNRRVRTYARYELRLSAHDEAKADDLEHALETVLGIVRQRADERWREGQPHIAFELHHSATRSGMEWMMCVVCQPAVAVQIDAALATAYPDLRLGHDFIARPEPVDGQLRRPRYVERLRKQRSFVYALGRDVETAAAVRATGGTPAIERIARAQATSQHASTVRITLVPTLHAVERLAAVVAQREADRAAGGERWGASEAGLRAPQRHAELDRARRTQGRSLAWFEIVVASDDEGTVRTVTAAVQAVRGDNRLHRRTLDLRPRRTRDRFVAGDPPLLPLVWFNWLAPPFTMVLGLRTLISTAELAQLVELPTAGMRDVPVRRLMVPRVPAPPEAFGTVTGALELPPADDEPFDPAAIRPEATTALPRTAIDAVRAR